MKKRIIFIGIAVLLIAVVVVTVCLLAGKKTGTVVGDWETDIQLVEEGDTSYFIGNHEILSFYKDGSGLKVAYGLGDRTTETVFDYTVDGEWLIISTVGNPDTEFKFSINGDILTMENMGMSVEYERINK